MDEKKYCYCYDMKRADYLIKQGFRNRIIGAGTGAKGDSYLLFYADDLFWASYNTYNVK